MGGGTSHHTTHGSSELGLSPRGRGNLVRSIIPTAKYRSIPAWAGEPLSVSLRPPLPKPVYPRVGGGTSGAVCDGLSVWGLSPRGRGNLFGIISGRHVIRSIPAWAGEPVANVPSMAAVEVYPRVGGGTVGIHILGLAGGQRSIPAWAGEPWTAKRGGSLFLLHGLSPRGRGNRRIYVRCDDGSIPAWAGEP